MPENSDLMIIQCKSCWRWFHCFIGHVDWADHFVCIRYSSNHVPLNCILAWPAPFIPPLLENMATTRKTEQMQPLFSQPWPIVLYVATCKKPRGPEWGDELSPPFHYSAFWSSLAETGWARLLQIMPCADRIQDNHPVVSTKCEGFIADWVAIATGWNQAAANWHLRTGRLFSLPYGQILQWIQHITKFVSRLRLSSTSRLQV